MLHYGTGVAQEAELFHVKHSTRHQSLARSEATQTYNLRFRGIGNGGYMHRLIFYTCFNDKHNTTGVSTNIRTEGRQMPVTEELIDI